MADIQDNGFYPTINLTDLKDCKTDAKFVCDECGDSATMKEAKTYIETGHQFWYTDSGKFFCDDGCATAYCNHKNGTEY